MLAALIGETLGQAEDGSDPLVGLDQLRLSFLTSLSHELRTPLTAIKIALDGLFADGAEGKPPASEKLIAITQRNLDRIIRLVESQLDLLQVTLGEVTVSRRLTSLKAVVASAAGVSRCEGVKATREDVKAARHRHRAVVDGLYLFTDPDRLRSVIEYFLSSASGAFVESCHVENGGRDIVIEITNTDTARVPLGDAPLCAQGSALNALLDLSCDVSDFERRACRHLVKALGGRVSVSNGGGVERTRLFLPVFPEYERGADYTTPLEHLHRAAVLNGRRVTLVKCTTHGSRREAGRVPAADREFLQRCLSTLSDGDVLVRGWRDGEYYLGVVERTDAHVEEMIAFLETPVFPQTGRVVAAEMVLRTDEPFSNSAPFGTDVTADRAKSS
jgi:hypothetical protein